MIRPTVAGAYGLDDVSAPGASNWGPYFYFGNLPQVFAGQDFGDEFSPIGNWAPANSYRGQCPNQRALTGISASPSTHLAHGIHCGSVLQNQTGTCHAMTVGTVDNRAYTDNNWDWDVGYVKVECAVNEYVQGVSHSTSGVLNGILCCPASGLNRQVAGAVVVYNGNAGLPYEHDWDVGYFKGICAPSQFISGISKLASSSQGTPGRIHALLCSG
jgi:hypothetical protein